MRLSSFIKASFSFSMILAFAFHVGSGVYLNIWHFMANESFTESFCINKEAPEKSCHGSCMMKKINKAPEENNDLDKSFYFAQHEISSFIVESGNKLPSKSFIFLKENNTFYFFSYKKEASFDFYHPPEISLI